MSLDYNSPKSTEPVLAASPDGSASYVSLWGGAGMTVGTSQYILHTERCTRVRQKGTISKVSFYVNTMTQAPTDFRILIWRRTGIATDYFDLVGISNNLVSGMTVGENIKTLTTPIEGVLPGDYVGTYTNWATKPAVWNFTSYAAKTIGGAQKYSYLWHGARKLGVPPIADIDNPGTVEDVRWIGGTNPTEAVLFYQSLPLYIAAPVWVAGGDSIPSGYPGNTSLVDNVNGIDSDTPSIPTLLAAALGEDLPFQNMAISGQLLSTIYAGLAGIKDLYPAWMLINGGTNDLTSLYAQESCVSTITTYWANILANLVANNIKPVVLGITPRNPSGDAEHPLTSGIPAGPDALMVKADAVNAWLAANVENIYGGIYIDTMAVVGEERTGGTAGNKWNLIQAYSADGLHINAAGNAKLVTAIYDAILDLEPVSYAGRICALADVKDRLGITAAEYDDMINRIIISLADFFDRYTNRILLLPDAAVTEYYATAGRWLRLKRYPIVSITSIKEAADYDFTNADALVADTDYRLVEIGKDGYLYKISGNWSDVPDSIQIVYRGGFVAAGQTPGTGEIALPNDLREAAILQASLIYKRRLDIGLSGQSFDGGSINKFTEIELLPIVKQTLEHYTRRTL